MKSSLIYFFFFIGKFISYLYPYKLHRIIVKFTDKLYTGWIAGQLKYFHIKSAIKYPINIIGGKYITIGKKTSISRYGVITAWDKYMNSIFTPQIIIGDNVSIGEYCHITAINKIVIGNGVLTGRWVTITDNSHGRTDIEQFYMPPLKRELYSPGTVIIDDNVWIGDKVTILPNVHIGKNVIIGANTVVTKDIPPNSIACGVPAKIIKPKISKE
jgi:acetyltransferase-like isoleucine patch superfamily enzyme